MIIIWESKFSSREIPAESIRSGSSFRVDESVRIFINQTDHSSFDFYSLTSNLSIFGHYSIEFRIIGCVRLSGAVVDAFVGIAN